MTQLFEMYQSGQATSDELFCFRRIPIPFNFCVWSESLYVKESESLCMLLTESKQNIYTQYNGNHSGYQLSVAFLCLFCVITNSGLSDTLYLLMWSGTQIQYLVQSDRCNLLQSISLSSCSVHLKKQREIGRAHV